MPYKGSDSNTEFDFNYRSIDWSTLSGGNEARVISQVWSRIAFSFNTMSAEPARKGVYDIKDKSGCD